MSENIIKVSALPRAPTPINPADLLLVSKKAGAEFDSYSTTAGDLQALIFKDVAYNTIQAGLNATQINEQFYVYTDSNKFFVEAYTNVGGTSYLPVTADGKTRIYPTGKFFTEAALKSDLSSLAPGKGGNQVGFARAKPSSVTTSVNQALNGLDVSIWEFANLITSKPNPDDPQTWDWYPALQAAINYVMSYVSQTAVNATMFGSKRLYVPAGIYQTSATLLATKQGNSTGSLTSALTIIGDGMTSSIIQPMTQGITTLKATSCKVNLLHIGFRAGASYCYGVELGDPSIWQPVVHCHWTSVGFSGFAKSFIGNLLFDSTFEDLFVQNITAMADPNAVSTGIEIALYSGLANGGVVGDGSGDDSNQLTFIRPTVETAVADNSILLNVIGKNSAFAHHAFNIYGGHFETHNLKAKCYNFRNMFNCNIHGVVFAQNGPAVDTFYRLGFIDSCWNLNFTGGRQVTTNRLAAYADTDAKFIKIIGNSKNIRFLQQHFIGPYNDIAAYNRGTRWLFDTTESTKGKRSYSTVGSTVSVFTNKEITPELRVTNDGVSSSEYILTADDNGNLVISYSTDSTDTIDPTSLATFLRAGALQTTGNVQIGANSATGVTRGIDFMNSGDKTTVIAGVRSDNVGRLYFVSFNSAQQWVMASNSYSPSTDNAYTLGTSALRPSATYAVKYMFTATVGAFYGTGSPEGAVAAGIGSTFQRSDGGAVTSFYVKETGTGNTGWVAK